MNVVSRVHDGDSYRGQCKMYDLKKGHLPIGTFKVKCNLNTGV